MKKRLRNETILAQSRPPDRALPEDWSPWERGFEAKEPMNYDFERGAPDPGDPIQVDPLKAYPKERDRQYYPGKPRTSKKRSA